MKAWLWDGSTGLQNLRLSEVPVPVVADNEVVLALDYAALNPADQYLAENRYPYPVYPPLPHVLGRDGMGTIVTIGNGVTGIKVGDRRAILRGDVGVFRWGTFAEQVSISAETLVEIPAGWTDEEASGATLVYLSAYHALTLWEPLDPGSVVVVSGASGGVGVAAVQLAAAMGHIVVALSRSEEKQQKLKKLGASFAFDPANPHWKDEFRDAIGPRGAKLAIDTVGGKLLLELIDVMGDLGRLSLVGNLDGAVPSFDTGVLFSRRIRIGPMAVGYYTPQQNLTAWRNLVEILQNSEARPEIDQIYPFELLPKAFERLSAGPMGKVIIRIKS
jgi:NADPH:quinone reductase